MANTGNATLTGVVVTDPNADAGSIVRGADVVGDNDGLLEVGETWGYTAAHTVTQAEIDATAAATATSTTRRRWSAPRPVRTPTTPRCRWRRTPALNIVKEAVPGQTADVAGETINYTITVANTGNATLTGVVVTDPNADADSIVRGRRRGFGDDDALEVGETWSYTATHTVTQAEIDATAAATATSTTWRRRQRPDRSGHRRCHGAGGADPGAEHREGRASVPAVQTRRMCDGASDVINYTITVTNTGNATLTGVVVTDPNADPGHRAGAPTWLRRDGELEVGETWSYTAAHTVTQAEIDATAAATATSTTWRRRTAPRPVRTPTMPRCRWRRARR